MIHVVLLGCKRVAIAALMTLLVCANAVAECDDKSHPVCGESAQWRVEFVDFLHTEDPRYFRVRTINKRDGTSAISQIQTDHFGGDVRTIQVHRARALVISYVTRGLYHVALLDLATQERVASFIAWGLTRSPDRRYLLYRVGHSAVGPWDTRMFLLDLQGVDDTGLTGRRGDSLASLVHSGMKIGRPIYELPGREGYPKVDHERRTVDFGSPHVWLDLVWDLEHERLLLVVPDNEETRSLVTLSLTSETLEPTCRIPVHPTEGEAGTSASLRHSTFDLSYAPVDDVAAIKITHQDDVRLDIRVSLADACASQRAPSRRDSSEPAGSG